MSLCNGISDGVPGVELIHKRTARLCEGRDVDPVLLPFFTEETHTQSRHSPRGLYKMLPYPFSMVGKAVVRGKVGKQVIRSTLDTAIK